MATMTMTTLSWQLLTILGTSLLLGCSSSSSSPGGTDGGSSPSNENVIAGVTVPSATPVCKGGAEGGALTVVSGAQAAFSWSAVPKATQYGVKISKSAKGATTETVVIDKLVPSGPSLGISAGEGDAGSFYRIEGVALEGTTALCLLDGANGIQM